MLPPVYAGGGASVLAKAGARGVASLLHALWNYDRYVADLADLAAAVRGSAK